MGDEEIERLRGRLEHERFAEDLRDALTLASTAATIGSPVKYDELLTSILKTAAHVISARAGSLFLIDASTEELMFEVAIGPEAEEVKRFRVPLGKGIAGLVAMSGQPMAISDAKNDPKVYEEIGEKIGYEPDSILAVPLYYGDRVIGVMELLDKEGAPAFSQTDMETLGMFAVQAAVAIELSRTYRHLAPLVGEVLASLDAPEGQKRALRERSAAFAQHVEEGTSYQEALELAELVQEIAWSGDEEARACRAVLQSFADYLRSRQELTGDVSW